MRSKDWLGIYFSFYFVLGREGWLIAVGDALDYRAHTRGIT